ncbi:MAG TPA: hypothetical protein VHM00_16800 [Caldimonas sp.]|jgi:hypothetical protein|nr:hypothetical protein [Caldimonas sp.]HEX2542731.1 hypothetical protein [Caldimonas sp.]
MKHYVLDDTAPDVSAARPAASGTVSRRWRLLAALVIVEPLALAGFYVAVAGGPSTGVAADAAPQRRLESQVAHRPAVVADARLSTTAVPLRESTAPPVAASLDPAGPGAKPKTSRVAHHGGKWIVELHGADLRSTLALLSATTRATVTGTEVLAGHPTRFHRELVASSPTEAWTAVFGDIANFAITCAAPGCAVHFASAVQPVAVAAPRLAVAAALTEAEMPEPPPEPPPARPAATAQRPVTPTTDSGDPSSEN